MEITINEIKQQVKRIEWEPKKVLGNFVSLQGYIGEHEVCYIGEHYMEKKYTATMDDPFSGDEFIGSLEACKEWAQTQFEANVKQVLGDFLEPAPFTAKMIVEGPK